MNNLGKVAPTSVSFNGVLTVSSTTAAQGLLYNIGASSVMKAVVPV